MEGLIGRNFAFQNGLGSTLKTAKTLRKQYKTASTNSSWTYNREGLLSEGRLRLRFGGLIFGRVFFLGGEAGVGAYYRNFTVFCIDFL